MGKQEAAEEKKEDKKEKEKKEKPKKKDEGAGISPAERMELEQLKNDIIARKKELKEGGMTGGQINKDEQVAAWVARMNELKEKEKKAIKDNKQYIDAEKISKGKEPQNGFFMKKQQKEKPKEEPKQEAAEEKKEDKKEKEKKKGKMLSAEQQAEVKAM